MRTQGYPRNMGLEESRVPTPIRNYYRQKIEEFNLIYNLLNDNLYTIYIQNKLNFSKFIFKININF